MKELRPNKKSAQIGPATKWVKMHKKIKVLRKSKKKGGAAGIRTQVVSLAGTDSTPAPLRELAEYSLEVGLVFEDKPHMRTHVRAQVDFDG